MKLLLLSSPHFFVEEDKILATLFEEGLDVLHLRKLIRSRCIASASLLCFPTNTTNV